MEFLKKNILIFGKLKSKMSRQRDQLSIGAKELIRRRKQNSALPVKEQETIVYPSNIKTRLLQTNLLPERVIDLILNTTYNDPLTGRAELLFPEAQEIFTQLEEIIRVYDLFRGINTNTGREVDVAIKNPQGVTTQDANILTVSNTESKPPSTITEDEAIAKFEDHINALVKIRETKLAKVNVRYPLIKPEDNLAETMKIRQTLIIKDETIFDSPALAEIRRQELIKISLITRKRKPIPGKCPKCGYGLIYMDEKFIRSGDEGGVIFRQCYACEYEWH